MKTPWWLAALCAAVPAVASSQVPAPTPTPSGPAITLPPVEAELVQIDVVVTDKKGGLVRGLKPEDFEVLEDGKRQTITHFRDGRGRPLPLAQDAPVVVTPEGQETPDDWQGRYMVLAIDDLHMTPGNMMQAKKSLRRFVDEQAGQEDLIAVVATSGALGYYQSFTRPGVALTRAIDRLSPRPRNIYDPFLQIGEYQAELIDRGDPQALRLATEEIIQRQPGTDERTAATQAQSTAQRIVAETQHYSKITLGTIEDVVRSLAPLPGRKVLVLATDGFLVGLGTRSSQAYDLRQIVDAATRSGVVVYSVDTRGLTAMVPGGDASEGLMPVLSAPGLRQSMQFQEEHALRDAMGSLADDTGGFLVTSTNDLGNGFQRIVADNETYYVLAYEPTNSQRDGRFRKLQVKLPGRRDLRIRTRRGYFAPDDRKRPSVAAMRDAAAADAAARREAGFQRGLGSLFPLRELPVALSADFVRIPVEGSQVVVSANVDLAKANFTPGPERQEGAIEIVAVVYNETGGVAANLQAQRVGMSLRPETHDRVIKEGLRYRKTAKLSPGLYQVRLVAREESTGRLGSASEWIEIPDLAPGKMALSSVFLAARPPGAVAGASSTPPAAEAPSGGAPSAPATGVEAARDVQARKRFGRDETMTFQLFVYNAERDASGATDVVLQAQVWSGPRMVASSPVAPVPLPREANTPPEGAYTSSFPLGSFAPGSYELRLMVSDRKGGQNQLRRVNFLVE